MLGFRRAPGETPDVSEPGTLIARVDGCDLAGMDQCESCGEGPVIPEHAHSKCLACGYIRPCCGWG
jgi:hypothetical protein